MVPDLLPPRDRYHRRHPSPSQPCPRCCDELRRTPAPGRREEAREARGGFRSPVGTGDHVDGVWTSSSFLVSSLLHPLGIFLRILGMAVLSERQLDEGDSKATRQGRGAIDGIGTGVRRVAADGAARLETALRESVCVQAGIIPYVGHPLGPWACVLHDYGCVCLG